MVYHSLIDKRRTVNLHRGSLTREFDHESTPSRRSESVSEGRTLLTMAEGA